MGKLEPNSSIQRKRATLFVYAANELFYNTCNDLPIQRWTYIFFKLIFFSVDQSRALKPTQIIAIIYMFVACTIYAGLVKEEMSLSRLVAIVW